MLDVIRMHRHAMRGIKPDHVQSDLYMGAQSAWDNALELGEKHGFKNSQVTVLAPTGTIGLHDGLRQPPASSLTSPSSNIKSSSAAAYIKIVNNTVPAAGDEARLHARADQRNRQLH